MTGWMKLLEAKAFWGVDELQARLVAAVDERDAARKLYDERQDDWIVERQSLQELNAQLVKNHDAMQAERDAAQAGEARAVGALRTIRGADIYPDADGLIEDFTCFYCHRNSVDGCDEDCPRVIAAEVIDSAQPTLDWLAQQRREAAAEALDRLAGEWWAFNDEYIASELSARAAALRAGEVGNE